jgi:hypothetical protein
MESSQDKQLPRTVSVLLGVLIGLVAFVVVLAVIAWIVPDFLRLTDSPWSDLLGAMAIVFISFSGWIQWRRASRVNHKRKETPAWR